MLKLVCPRCHAMFSIPEEAGRGKDLPGIECPLCREQFEFEHGIPQDAEDLGSANHGSTSVGSESASDHHDDEISRPDLIEAGGKRGLLFIADQALSARIIETIRKLDFHIIVARDSSFALKELEHHPFNLIMLDEIDGRDDSRENPVLRHLQHLPMPLRRMSFVCLLSGKKSSFDRRAAFCAGVELIVNSQDLEKMRLILNRMIEEHQAFYGVFNDELDKRGTSLA